MCKTKITDDIRDWMENKACFDEIYYDLIKKNYIPWFGKRSEIEPLLNDIDEEYSKLRELLAMYVAFGMAAARDCTFQNAYRDGMGKKLNETEMRKRAFQMGIDITHI